MDETTRAPVKLGQFFAVKWTGRGRAAECHVSPGFLDSDAVYDWLGRSRRYVLKQKVEPCPSALDGYVYIDSCGV